MIKRNDIVFVELPPPLGGIGHEQTGRRPAVAIQDELATLPTILVLPLTSHLGALRFPFTLRIEPSAVNGLSMPSVALLFQIQVVDRRRVVRMLGTLEPAAIGEIDATMQRMLKL